MFCGKSPAEALILGANRIVVRDTAHLMYLEHPDVFATLVEQFANRTLAQEFGSRL